MIENIRQLVNDDVVLSRYETELKSILQFEAAGEDRLRRFMQLVILSRACCDALESIDKSDVLSGLLEESGRKQQHIHQMLAAESSELREKYEEIVSRENELMAEISAHYECLSSIADSVRPWDAGGEMASLKESVNASVQQLDKGLKDLVDVRKSDDFARLCQMEKGNL